MWQRVMQSGNGSGSAKRSLFGFKINPSISNPSNNISYNVQYNGTDVDNVLFGSARMNYDTAEFEMGGWLEDDFFIPRPCMLKYDGTVDYYLNPNDYTKKEDGTTSDVANTSYSGNAMMEWGRNGKQIWYKIVPDSTIYGATVYIADSKKDDDFVAWSFVGRDGTIKDHFYTSIYNGSNISSKLRSLSGQTCINNVSGTNEITYANANGTGWHTEIFADRILINLLLMLIGKSTNTQATFGNGHYTGGSSVSDLLATGTMNKKGLFWGTNGTGSGVKVFGIENWWGNQWRRIAGLVNVSGTQKYKLTYGKEDGSTVNGWNDDGSGYKTVANGTPSGTNGGYLNQMIWNADGMFGKTASGSETTYYCDSMWFNNSRTDYALVGGACFSSWICGAFALDLDALVSSASWKLGASVSYHS